MRDGQIDQDKIWYSFDEDELRWLYSLIPNGDSFKNTVARGIQDLGFTVPEDVPVHLVDFSAEEIKILKRLAREAQ